MLRVVFSGRVSGDVVAGRSLFSSAVTALEEVFITVFTAVRKDLYKYRKLIKVCFLLVSHVASGPRESLIKYSKFKTKTLHSVYTAIRVREINDIQALQKWQLRI